MGCVPGPWLWSLLLWILSFQIINSLGLSILHSSFPFYNKSFARKILLIGQWVAFCARLELTSSPSDSFGPK
jgi:hypothetical protein